MAAGDLNVGGVLTAGQVKLGTGGVNRLWREQLLPNGGGLWPWAVQACGGPTLRGISQFAGYTLDFDKDASETAAGLVVLPPWYTGQGLLFDLMWSALSGSGDVRWRVYAECVAHDAALAVVQDTFVSATASLTAANDLVRTQLALAPKNAAANSVMQVLVQRVATNVADTLEADALLFGVGVSVAQ
jgi:hypothetical protein